MSATQQEFKDWVRSDRYHNSFLLPLDDALEHALKASTDNGLPEIAVSAAQGKFLNLHARAIGAQRILEVGTLGGYSAICLARAITKEGGELITMEIDEKHAKVAQANIDYAGLTSKVKIMLGPGVESLPKLASEPQFDLAFIDADKESNLEYFLEAKRLVRKGGIIIVDNVVRRGNVANLEQNDSSSLGVRRLLEHIKTDKSVEATTIATVGEKGWDGFLYAILL